MKKLIVELPKIFIDFFTLLSGAFILALDIFRVKK